MSSSHQYPKLRVESPNLQYTVNEKGQQLLESLYEYQHVKVTREADLLKVSRPLANAPLSPPTLRPLTPALYLYLH